LFEQLDVKRGSNAAPLFDLRAVTDFSVENSRGISDTRLPGPVARQKL
jgi:hypothetical protein